MQAATDNDRVHFRQVHRVHIGSLLVLDLETILCRTGSQWRLRSKRGSVVPDTKLAAVF